MENIVLQINDFFKYAFINSGQILDFLNNIFARKYNSIIYFEEIENAMLFIFKDMDSFKLRCQPLKNSTLEPIPPSEFAEDKLSKKIFVPQYEFPKDGISIEINVISGDPIQIIPYLKQFIKSIDSSIRISEKKQATISLNIPHYNIVKKYANSLIRRYYL